MGKRYLPVEVACSVHKLYLEDLTKIHRVNKKTYANIPPYLKPRIKTKSSINTQPDDLLPPNKISCDEDLFEY